MNKSLYLLSPKGCFAGSFAFFPKKFNQYKKSK
jgi:hypothetical protein